MPLRLRQCLVMLSCALFAVAAMAQGTDARAQIERLYRAGDKSQAMERLDTALAADPRDASLRFLKGVLLADQGRRAEAIEIYLALTREYPELPEPFNNLAVLYAADGRLDDAREALETALRNDPAYATAQENLGDIYVQLAQRAYGRADARSTAVQRKLQLARELLGGRPTEPS